MLHKKFIIQNGFTLIELLVVVMIIGLLATFVLTSVQKAQVKARDVRRVSDFHQIQLALAMYQDDQASYPGLAGKNQWGDSETAGTLVYELEKAGYIKPVPNDPRYPEQEYEYWVAEDKQQYILKAVLERKGEEINSSLKYDLDGDILGAICGTAGDPEGYYCVGL